MGTGGTGDDIRAIGGARSDGRDDPRAAGPDRPEPQALAARIAMHHNYLGTIERGDVPNPGLETVNRIAGGLGVSIGCSPRASRPRPRAHTPDQATDELPSSGPHDAYDARALGSAIRLVRRRAELTQVDWPTPPTCIAATSSASKPE